MAKRMKKAMIKKAMLTSSDILQEEKMKDCSCKSAKVTMYCEKPVKCNDQAYYCVNCMEDHDHKPVMISKATAHIS
jgi:hypothetical protein